MVDGVYQSPADLARVARILRAAEALLPGFWDALGASGMKHATVSTLTPTELVKRLKRYL